MIKKKLGNPEIQVLWKVFTPFPFKRFNKLSPSPLVTTIGNKKSWTLNPVLRMTTSASNSCPLSVFTEVGVKEETASFWIKVILGL